METCKPSGNCILRAQGRSLKQMKDDSMEKEKKHQHLKSTKGDVANISTFPDENKAVMNRRMGRDRVDWKKNEEEAGKRKEGESNLPFRKRGKGK